MTRIPRSDRYEAQLTPRQLRTLHAALLSGTRRIEDIRKTAPPWRTGTWAGQRPSMGTLSHLRERLQLRQTVEENNATTDILATVLRDALPGITQDQLDTIGHKTFTTLAIRRQDSQTFLRLSAARNHVEIERQRLAQREAALNLARQKFRQHSCERFLKWSEDRRLQEIAIGPGSNAEKIELLGQIMFGDEWNDPEPEIPEPVSGPEQPPLPPTTPDSVGSLAELP